MSWDLNFFTQCRVKNIIEKGKGFSIEFLAVDDQRNGYGVPIAGIKAINPKGKESTIVVEMSEEEYDTKILSECSANAACMPTWVLYQLYIQFGLVFCDLEYEWYYLCEKQMPEEEEFNLYLYCCYDTMLNFFGHLLDITDPLFAKYDELVPLYEKYKS